MRVELVLNNKVCAKAGEVPPLRGLDPQKAALFSVGARGVGMIPFVNKHDKILPVFPEPYLSNKAS